MEKSLVNDYLSGTGMEAAQAEALSQILGQTATSQDLLIMQERIDGRLRAMDERIDGRLQAMEQKLDSRLQAMDEKLDSRLQAMDTKLDSRLREFEQQMALGLQDIRNEMSKMEVRLTVRFLAFLLAFATILAAMEIFVR